MPRLDGNNIVTCRTEGISQPQGRLNATTPISYIGLNNSDGLWLSFAPIRSGVDYRGRCYGLQLEGRYLVMSGGVASGSTLKWLLQTQEIEPP